jgi:hypothetical protein
LHRPEEGEPFSIVGGYALATSIMCDGTITQKVFYRWSSDRVGERIAVAPATGSDQVQKFLHLNIPRRVDTSPVVALNRQQRRAAERAQRKASR